MKEQTRLWCYKVTLIVSVCGLLIYFILANSRFLGDKLGSFKFTNDESQFFVDRYNLRGDTLEVIGTYRNNSLISDKPATIRLEGLSYLVNQIKYTNVLDNKLSQVELPYAHYFNNVKNFNNVNCFALFHNDKREVERSANKAVDERKTISAEQYINMASNCSMFISNRGYMIDLLIKVEEEFPVAFSIMIHKDPAQAERLLRAIYRPEHTYCIHLDKKSDVKVYQAMAGIASCFDNVFMSSRRLDVRWGQFSLLEADLICINDLWKRNRKWKYLLTLTGQEFPLRTNYEMVQILMALDGANDVQGTRKRANKNRWKKAGPPPHNIVPVKGSFHVTLSRRFVDYMLHDPRSLDLLEWVKNTSIPDETYYATLNYNFHLDVPGSYGANLTDEERRGTIKPYLSRYKNWGTEKCFGKRVRQICIYGSGDLPALAARKELFANKFYWNYQHAIDCMEELIYNRTRDQYLGKMSFDPTWYTKLDYKKLSVP